MIESGHVFTNTEIHFQRVRYAIAVDQYFRECEKLFTASHYGLGKLVDMPSRTMLEWAKVIEEMEAEGWGRLVR